MMFANMVTKLKVSVPTWIILLEGSFARPLLGEDPPCDGSLWLDNCRACKYKCL